MDRNKIKGIEGWLLWFTIILFLTAAIYGLSFIIWMFNLYLGEYNYETYFYFFTSALMLFLYVQTIILELKKKKKFIKSAKIALSISILLTFVELFTIVETSSYIIGSIIGTGVWIWYLNVSVRVKNTFIKK